MLILPSQNPLIENQILFLHMAFALFTNNLHFPNFSSEWWMCTIKKQGTPTKFGCQQSYQYQTVHLQVHAWVKCCQLKDLKTASSGGNQGCNKPEEWEEFFLDVHHISFCFHLTHRPGSQLFGTFYTRTRTDSFKESTAKASMIMHTTALIKSIFCLNKIIKISIFQTHKPKLNHHLPQPVAAISCRK